MEIPDCEDFRYINYGDGRFSLQIADLFSADSGTWKCEAFNEHGEAVTTGCLTVAGKVHTITVSIIYETVVHLSLIHISLKQFEHKSCKAIDMSSVIKMFSETKAQKMPFNIVLLKSLLFWHR